MKNLVLTLANLAGYAVAAVALFALLPVADLSLPWWVPLPPPAVVYTLVVKMCCPRANTAEAIGIVALLFIAHAALASATGMVYAALTELPYPTAFAVTAWQYLPAPVLQVLCASLVGLPGRAVARPGRRAPRRAGRGTPPPPGPRRRRPAAEPVRGARDPAVLAGAGRGRPRGPRPARAHRGRVAARERRAGGGGRPGPGG